MIENEIFSKVQLVVKEIIEERGCQEVTGKIFYQKFIGKFSFLIKLLIDAKRKDIIDTFNSTIESIRDTLPNKLEQCCLSATDENVNKFISLFLEGKPEPYIASWNTYLARKSSGGNRKTRRHNNKKTKKVYQKTMSTRKNRILKKSKRMKYKKGLFVDKPNK
jgi:hypothetical protein